MVKARIVQRTGPTGKVRFVIQQKHFLFRWWWVDAWINSSCGACCQDSFDSIEEAMMNLPYFDDSKATEEVIYDAQ
jgi:hypothetical protein